MYSTNEEEYISLINIYRKKLEEMMINKNLNTDEELVKQSQELDKLIAVYYEMKRVGK